MDDLGIPFFSPCCFFVSTSAAQSLFGLCELPISEIFWRCDASSGPCWPMGLYPSASVSYTGILKIHENNMFIQSRTLEVIYDHGQLVSTVYFKCNSNGVDEQCHTISCDGRNTGVHIIASPWVDPGSFRSTAVDLQ